MVSGARVRKRRRGAGWPMERTFENQTLIKFGFTMAGIFGVLLAAVEAGKEGL